MKYVIAEVSGGTGNQLFKYTAARLFAWSQNAELILDLSKFVGDEYNRDYLLDTFPGPQKCRRFIAKSGFSNLLRRGVIGLGQLIPSPFFRTFRDRNKAYFLDLCGAKQGTWAAYMKGYWMYSHDQSSSHGKLMDELAFNLELDQSGLVLLHKIQANENPVALHFRSYHDVPSPENRWLTSKDYYERCIQRTLQEIQEPFFFVFTDTDEFPYEYLLPADRFLLVPRPAMADNRSDLNTLLLMSFCKHFITARSSFSWWAAWFSQTKWGNPSADDLPHRLLFYPNKNLPEQNRLPAFGLTAY